MQKTMTNLFACAGLAAIVIVPLSVALARPEKCFKDGEEAKCDYDLWCAFKVDLAEKILIYNMFIRNSPATKKFAKATRQGVKYNGKLYNQALSETRKANPGVKDIDLIGLAYDRFAKKVREQLSATKYRDCSLLGVEPKQSLLGTWRGMKTNMDDCSVFGVIPTSPGADDREVVLDTLLDESEGCREFYDSDRGHEAIHEDFCGRRLAGKLLPVSNLKEVIEEDIQAYRYSLQQSSNNLRRLQLLCSADPGATKFRMRADQLLKQLKAYKLQEANRP